MGLGWIPMVLNFLGITNPISIISQVIGFGAVFSWFFAFVFYFRDYSRWRKRLNREIAEARFYLKAVSELSTEKGRLRFLHQEMHEYLGLMAKILHNPWFVSEEWIDYEGTRLDATKLPKSMDVAVPREVGAFNDVKTRALEHFISGNWRTDQVSILFEEYEKSNAMRTSSISSRIDEDGRLRRKLRSEIASDQYLKRVGDRLIENLTEYVQSKVLPEETGFSVDSIKPDELAGLKMKASIFDSSDDLVKWEDFISEVLGKAGSWQQINFSSSGQLDNLFDRRSITSYALIPERLDRKIDEEIKKHVVDKDDKAGVEVIVRVDVSNWIDGDKIN
jgi:predicted house-cleaning noncanonical NTP pyrophosphatase (MazG superfamily)